MTAPITLSSVGITTSESLIQRLRGSADPIESESGSIAKIDLAVAAWHHSMHPSPSSSSVHIPQVTSLLLSWILDVLTRSAKAKSSTSATSPLANPAYYKLLSHLLQDFRVKDKGSLSLSSLSPNSTPQALLSVLSSLLQLPLSDQRRCIPPAAAPFAALLGSAVPSLANAQTTRAVIDEQFAYIFKSASELRDDDQILAQTLAKLTHLLKDPWLEGANETSALSQKSYTTFVSTHLASWCAALRNLSNRAHSHHSLDSLRQLVAQVGEGCLFGLYGIKSALFPTAFAKSMAPTVSLRQVIRTSKTPLALAQLSLASIRGLRRHANELQVVARAQGKKASHNVDDVAMDVDGVEQEPEKGTSLYALLFDNLLKDILEVVAADLVSTQSAQACAATLQVFADTKLAAQLSRTPSWTHTLSSSAEQLINAAQTVTDAAILKQLIAAARTLWAIDEDILRSRIHALLRALCAATIKDIDHDTHLQAHALLSDLFKTFARSQDTPQLLNLFGTALLGSPHLQWQATALFQPRSLNTLVSTYVKSSISPPQVAETLRNTARLMEKAYSSGPPSVDVTPKKRKASELDAAPASLNTSANVLRFVHPILASMPVPFAMIEQVRPNLDQIAALLISRLEEVTEGAQKRNPHGNLNEDAAEPVLWAWYGLCAGLKAIDTDSGLQGFPESSRTLSLLQPMWSRLVSAATSGHNITAMTRVVLFCQELQLLGAPQIGLPDPGVLKAFWLNIAAVISSSSTQAAPLWEMLLKRWFFVLEHTADDEVLRELSRVLLSSLNCSSQLYDISSAACQSAEFLELEKWRCYIMELVLKDCKDDVHDDVCARTLAALSHFPLQYVPAESKEAILCRALQVTSNAVSQGAADVSLIRRWLSQAACSQGSMRDALTTAVKASLPRLASEGRSDRHAITSLRQWLTKLLDNHQLSADELRELVDSNMKDDAALQTMVAETLIASAPGLRASVSLPALGLSRIESPFSKTLTVITLKQWLQHARLALVLAGLDERKTAEPSPKQQSALQVIDEAMGNLTPKLGSIGGKADSHALLQEYLGLATLLLHCSPRDGKDIATQTLTDVGLIAGDKETHSDVDKSFHRFMLALTPDQYDHVLNTLSVQSRDAEVGGLLETMALALRFGPEGTLVIAQKHLTRLLIRLQSSLASRDRVVESGQELDVTVQRYLRAVATICNGRAMVIRAQDAPLLLSICSWAVAPCGTEKDLSTGTLGSLKERQVLASGIFSTILDILNTLVRLRKELLLPILPQLSLLLTQLPQLFVRPLSSSLRSLQTRRLLGSFPLWLAQTFLTERQTEVGYEDEDGTVQLTSEGGLAEADARQFARLLDTLTSKTTALSRRENALLMPSSTMTTSGAESLSRPFSKHAIYVILSYIHALLNPIPGGSNSTGSLRAFIPPDVRKEVRRGLESLCQVINESERDWVLVAELLDESGKNVFKDIWKSWEAARYKGE